MDPVGWKARGKSKVKPKDPTPNLYLWYAPTRVWLHTNFKQGSGLPFGLQDVGCTQFQVWIGSCFRREQLVDGAIVLWALSKGAKNHKPGTNIYPACFRLWPSTTPVQPQTQIKAWRKSCDFLVAPSRACFLQTFLGDASLAINALSPSLRQVKQAWVLQKSCAQSCPWGFLDSVNIDSISCQ